MALNYSQLPVFTAHTSENNIWSPMMTVNECLAEDTADKFGEYYSRTWHVNQEDMEEWHFNSKDKVNLWHAPESNAGDIFYFLPSDPFEMGIQTSFTAITGWLEDLEIEYFRSNSQRTIQENYGLYSGWNLIWKNALKSRAFSNSVQSSENLDSSILTSSHWVNEKIDDTLDAINKLDDCWGMKEMKGSLSPYDNEFQQASNEDCVMGSFIPELQFGEEVEGAAKSERPHDAFKFCLLYLGLKDLLSVERVSSSLRSEVRGELLLWKSIHIERPLNEKITDDILFELGCRADGTLQYLSLVECFRITDDGIKRILETNPRLTKLFVPGCSRFTSKGILNIILTHNSNKEVPGIKQLKIGGRYDVPREHYEE